MVITGGKSCSSPSSDPNFTPGSSPLPVTTHSSALSPCIPEGSFLLQCIPGCAVLASTDTEWKGCAVKAALVGGSGSWQPSPHIPPDSKGMVWVHELGIGRESSCFRYTQINTQINTCVEGELIWPLCPTHTGRWCLTEPHSRGCEAEFCQN